jgi:GNAT superfamily N-acetyltransferase
MPAAEVLVRVAAPTDVDFIVASIRALADYERLSHQCTPDAARLTEHLFGERRFAEAMIAEIAGDRVGYALFFHSYSTFLTSPGIFLEDLFVHPDARRCGAGKALLDALVQLAKDRGYGRVEWSVLDWNEPAIRFYRGLGAKPQDEWTIYRVADESLTAWPARCARDDG